MEYKITEIIKEIKESLPEDSRYEIAQAYRAALKPQNVTSLLEERGLLCSDGSSKHPTERGKNKGISEELRTAADGREYYQVFYSEDARDLVRSILFSEYPALDPDSRVAFLHTVVARFLGTGIHASRRIAGEFPEHIIILYCPPVYRAYDDSADAICSAFDLIPHKNAAGVHGILIKPEDLEHVVIPRLLNGDRSFIVNKEDAAHCYTALRHTAPPAVPAGPERGRIARYGMCVEMTGPDGASETVYLASREHSREVNVHLVDGTILVTTEPITEKEGVRILSPGSALSGCIVGRRENTTFTLTGFTYKICRVFRSDAVNDRTIK